MNVGHIRKMIEGMSDDAPVMLFMTSAPSDDLNVTVDDIVPSNDKSRLNIHVSVVTDEELVEEDEEGPGEDDGTITDVTSGGYDVAIDGKFIGHAKERDEAEAMLKKWMDENKFYPDCWFISDHGNAVHIDV